MRKMRDVVQQLGKTLALQRQAFQFKQQFRIKDEVRVCLAQQFKDAREAMDVFHHSRRNEAMPLPRWTAAAIPVTPEREEGRDLLLREEIGIIFTCDKRIKIHDDLIGFELRVNADVVAQIFSKQGLPCPFHVFRRNGVTED